MHGQAPTASEASGRPAAGSTFHDLDDLLLGPTDLEAMPFELGCDFASAFDDKHLEVDAPGPSHAHAHSSSLSSVPRTKEGKRSHKRKSDASAIAPRALTPLASPVVLDSEHDDLSSLDPKSGSTQVGRWTKKEHELFLEGLRMYGKSWKKISSLVVTRTLVQIRTHAQKYLQKQTKTALKAAAAAAANGSAVPSSKSRSSTSHMLIDEPYPSNWKHHPSHHYGGQQPPSQGHTTVFLPIAFPEHGSSSSSSSSSSSLSSSQNSSSSVQLRKEFASHNTSTMSRLDRILYDESHSSLGNGDDYYSSPTGSDDDLVQWLQHRHLPYVAAGSPAATKRRRTDGSASWAIVNPMEAMSVSALPSHTSYFSSHSSSSSGATHGHHASMASMDFLPPLSSYASSSTSLSTPHADSDFNFGSSWL